MALTARPPQPRKGLSSSTTSRVGMRVLGLEHCLTKE
jgi:hypothetical protein